MSHNYFFEIQRYLNDRICAARESLSSHGTTLLEQQRLQGQIAAWQAFSEFLRVHFQMKLPKRLYRRWILQDNGDPNACAAKK